MERLNYVYMELAEWIERGIAKGEFHAGEKLPSLRILHRRTGKSMTTVYHAYMELERRGLVTCYPRSGFVINPGTRRFHLPEGRPGNIYPTPVPQTDLLSNLLGSLSDPSILPLGCAYASSDLMPGKHLSRIMRGLLSREPDSVVAYEDPAGNYGLRNYIARWISGRTGNISPGDIVIVNGGTEAIYIALKAVAERGDSILIESPAYPGVLQIMEEMGLFALEIPTDPVRGIDLASVREIADRESVKACFLTATVQNPMGYVMAEKDMKQLVSFLASRNIPIIEDDTYGELVFGGRKPSSLKYYDEKGLVIYLSSFSKTVGGGLRVAYLIPGQFFDMVRKIKTDLSLTSTTVTQKVLAEFICQGGLDRHLRKLTNSCRINLDLALKAVDDYFPDTVKVSSPAGGFLLWIEMPKGMDSMDVFGKAWEKGISIYPGAAFSVTGLYDNCFRINCGNTWNIRIEDGFRTLGGIVRNLCDEG